MLMMMLLLLSSVVIVVVVSSVECQVLGIEDLGIEGRESSN